MTADRRESYEFGDFRLDVTEHTLRHIDGSGNGALPEKAFQTLCVLVRNHGHLVSKDELLSQVWPDTIVEENNLDKCIHAIRQFLGEKDGGPKFIETVRKHGYRFVADVRRDAGSRGNLDRAASREDLDNAARETKPRRHKLGPAITLATLLIGAIGLAFYVFVQGSAGASRRSIAVLPVRPIDPANRNLLYEVGIADAMIQRLSSMKGFVVRPLSAVRQYSDVAQDAVAIGKEQQVDYVLAWNYQLAGERIRVTSQLYNVGSGEIEDIYTTEKETANFFAMQDAVAGELGNSLVKRFATTFDRELVKRGTTDQEAYRLYLHGKALTDNRNARDAKAAILTFEEAIRLDPNFAKAHAGLARAYIAHGNQGSVSPKEEYAKAREALQKAAEIDSELADVQAGLANVEFYDWNFTGNEASFRRAIELDPHSDWIHEDLAAYLSVRGRFDEAIAEAKIALEINPSSIATNRTYGRILYLARRYDEAITQFKRMIEALDAYEMWIFQAYEMKGDQASAYEWFLAMEQDPERREIYQAAYHDAGWLGVRRKVLEFEREAEDKPQANFYRLARQSVLVGEYDLTFHYLNKGFEKHNGQMLMLAVEPAFDPIRNDPRYLEVVERIGFK